MSTENLEFQISESNEGVRLDAFLADQLQDWSRSKLKKLIDNGAIVVNDKNIKSSYKLRNGDLITAELSDPTSTNFAPEDIPLDIVFEDEYLAVINKPAGMVVHPGAGVSSGTLANAIAFHFGLEPEGQNQRVGIVHRLDKDTSGLIVIAKNGLTGDKLAAQFRERRVNKSYIALVHGFVRKLSGKIDVPIARDRANRTKMAVDKNGRNAVSLYKVRRRYEKFTLLDVNIKTGRTHQIRVHLSHLNHPILGDLTYNMGRDNQIEDTQFRSLIKKMGRFFLHAEKLGFTHPVTKEDLAFEQPLPDELSEILQYIETSK